MTDNINITAPIVVKNAPERKVFGPVLIPDEPDYDGDVVTAEKIEQIHDLFNEKYQNIDVQHSLQNVGKIYTSYIAPNEVTFGDQTFPQGTWLIGVKVTDDEAWSLVEQGTLTGFSIMAINPVIGNATKGKNGRTTLADLGNDWIVNAVSLVTNPAVPRATFVAVKTAPEEDKENMINKIFKGLQGILQMIKSSTKAEDELNTKKNIEESEEVQDVTPEQVSQLIQEALAPIIEKIEAIQKPAVASEVPAEEKAFGKQEDELNTAEEKPEETKEPVEGESNTAEEKPEDNADNEIAKPEDELEKDELEKDESEDEEVKKPEEELKAELEEAKAKIAELETAQKSAYSKRLTGQDGSAPEQKQVIKSDRDALGRKIKK